MDAHRKEREYKTARKSEIQRAATEKKRTAYIILMYARERC
ncbi:hypothetical protein HMPREF1990_00717 [Porphyromonas gingivalis W4087]|nr:hypothetical protein HMPREF1990_00717 [Porphyromonas gingivalis W4087]